MHDARRLELWWVSGLLLVFMGCRGEQATVITSVDDVSSRPQATQETATAYVGDASCVECHEDITQQYHAHSMGRSLTPVARAEKTTSFAKGAEQVFTAGGFRYEVVQRDDELIHRQSRIAADGGALAVIEEEVKYAIGSGHHGRSYVVDHDGYLFMSPITWYPDKGIWDLSPGFETANSEFNRPIIEICLFCHANRAPRLLHTANRYSQPVFDGYAIGCERCHGPGQQHVQLHRTGGEGMADDQMIVNPSRLEPELREAVCQQCHLSGVARVLKPGRSLYDFRPGQPPDSCFSTFVLRPDLVKDERLVGQVEQMYQSRCFQASNGRLGCISCHDPHHLPSSEERTGFYRDRCLQCHPSDDCGLDEPMRRNANKDDSCMACHMPRHDTEVRHASAVNHRIPRNTDAPAEATSTAINVGGDGWPLVRFPNTAQDPSDFDRDLAIAMLMASSNHPEILEPQLLEPLLSTLEQASRSDPDDLDAYEYLGQTYLFLGRAGEALNAYNHVLRRQPGREVSLAVVADVLNSLGENRQAVEYWQRTLQVNPWMSRYWYGLAQAYAGSQQWQRCLETVQNASQRFPTSIGARQLLIESYLRLGQHQRAEETFDWLRRYDPRGMDSLLQWYESHPLRQ